MNFADSRAAPRRGRHSNWSGWRATTALDPLRAALQAAGTHERRTIDDVPSTLGGATECCAMVGHTTSRDLPQMAASRRHFPNLGIRLRDIRRGRPARAGQDKPLASPADAEN